MLHGCVVLRSPGRFFSDFSFKAYKAKTKSRSKIPEAMLERHCHGASKTTFKEEHSILEITELKGERSLLLHLQPFFHRIQSKNEKLEQNLRGYVRKTLPWSIENYLQRRAFNIRNYGIKGRKIPAPTSPTLLS